VSASSFASQTSSIYPTLKDPQPGVVAGFVVCELPQFVGDGLTCQRIGGCVPLFIRLFAFEGVGVVGGVGRVVVV